MSRAMLERAAMAGRRLAALLEQGAEISIRRRRNLALITVCVERGDKAPQWYDAGTLDGCLEQIDMEAK